MSAPVTVLFMPTPAEWTLRTPTEDAGLAILDSKLLHVEEGVLVTMPNAWRVRREFLAIREMKDLTEFLANTGSFRSPGPETFCDLTVWQEAIRRMVGTPPSEWEAKLMCSFPEQVNIVLQQKTPELIFQWRGGRPALVLWVTETLRAIAATIQIDHARGAKIGYCQRPDCGKEYTIKRRGHIYCSTTCAHTESVRRGRSGKQPSEPS